jgi:class 3 adenylate cyclase
MQKKKFLLAALVSLTLINGLGAADHQAPVTINLLDYPLYIKAGFDPADTGTAPDPSNLGPIWKVIERTPATATAVQIKDLDLPGIPRRAFLSPFGAREMEFTAKIPFYIEETEMAALTADDARLPGLFMASLGDNWEIYLNGHRVAAELDLDEAGRVTYHHPYRNFAAPLDKNFLRQGENILTMKIVGDPTYGDVGFFYAAPYYIGDYANISRQKDEILTMILIGVYLFMGFYHLFIYLIGRKELYNVFYGFFSLVVGTYFLVKTNSIYHVIPDQGFLLKIELFSLYLVFPLGALFLEYLCFKKSFLVTKIYSIFFALLAVTQLFFSLPYALDTLKLWQFASIGVIGIILICDIGYGVRLARRETKEHYEKRRMHLGALQLFLRVLWETPIGNLTVGALLCAATGVFDIIDSLYLHYGISASRYGFFIFTAGATLILARRFAFLYNQQRRIITRSNKGMNARLVDWIVVQDQDPQDLPSVNENSAIMFTDIRDFTRLSEKMPSQTLTNFLGALNEVLAKPLFEYQDQGFVAYTDKFLGDGTMNVFTDPAAALMSAVKLRSRLALFNANPRVFFQEAPATMKVNVGTGIAYGPVTLGIMGHSRRVDYTPIGNTVNMASRLEDLTKEYKVSILVNGALYNAIDHGNFNLRYIDRIRVRGRFEPEDIYEEFSSDSPLIRELKMSSQPKYRELQEMYFSGKDWNDAIRLADSLYRYSLKMLQDHGLGIDSPCDYLAKIYADRMRFISGRPELLERWDGVYTF